MKIEDFIKDEKLVLPEDEIDNIYIWTKVAATTKALLPAKAYYRLAKDAFDKDTKRIVDVVKDRNAWLKLASYELSDYLTITANKSKIFTSNSCLAYSIDSTVLHAILFYLAQTKNLYRSEVSSFSELLAKYVSDTSFVDNVISSDVLYLNAHAPLPDHKYKQIFLDAFATRRCSNSKFTLIHATNTSFIIGQYGYSEDSPVVTNRLLQDLSPLALKLKQRRQQDYKSIMSYWLSIMKFNPDTFVYSKVLPEEKLRKIDRYEQ